MRRLHALAFVAAVVMCGVIMPPETVWAKSCADIMERHGARYAKSILTAVDLCGVTALFDVRACVVAAMQEEPFVDLRARWAADATLWCGSGDPHAELGYHAECAAAPSQCAFAAPVLHAVGDRNDLLDCAQCRMAEGLVTGAARLYGMPEGGNGSAIRPCRKVIGEKGVDFVRKTLRRMARCHRDAGSIGECLAAPSARVAWDAWLASWRTAAERECTYSDPSSAGHSNYCADIGHGFPGTCVSDAPPCRFNAYTAVSAPGVDNDLLDCLACHADTAVLSAAAEIFGAHVCCVGSDCTTVRTRRSCSQEGGRLAFHRVEALPTSRLSGPHGVTVGADGSVYIADSQAGRVVKVDPAGIETELATGLGFVSGVAVDPATGRVLAASRCANKVFAIAPDGTVTPFAGTGATSPLGDGGPALAASLVAPNRLAIDAAGNTYISESGFLHASCGPLVAGRERIRMVTPDGTIHTFAGAGGFGTSGVGGPAVAAQLALPYSIAVATDGGLLIGEDAMMRLLKVERSGRLAHVALASSQGFYGAFSGDAGPAKRARVHLPCGVAQGPGGSIVVADMLNNRIRMIDRLGSIITIAGNGLSTFSPPADGTPGVFGQAICPEDIAVSPDGRIYFAALFEGKIRTLTVDTF